MKQPEKDRLFESIGQAAGALEISSAIISAAKKAGCPAFKAGGRVRESELVEWIAEHASENNDGMTDEEFFKTKGPKYREEVRKLKIINDERQGKSVLKVEIVAAVQRALSQVSQIAEAKLVNEYPSAVAGLDVPQARVYGRRLYDQLMIEFRKLSKEFPE